MNTASWSLHFVEADGKASFQLAPATDTLTLVEKEPESAGKEPYISKSGWEEIIDTLRTWADDVTLLEDDGIIPPSYPVVRKALSLSQTLMARGWAPPFRVVPNADGGILFEHGETEQFETIEIYSNGDLEYVAYENDKVVCMKPLDLSESR